MKLRLLIMSFCLSFIVSYPISAQTWRIWYTSYIDGHKYSFKISEEELPIWNLEKEESPVTIRYAVELAHANLKTIFPTTFERWKLGDITLVKITETKWIYDLDFECAQSEVTKNSDARFKVFVKMDGSVIESQIDLWDGGPDKVYGSF